MTTTKSLFQFAGLEAGVGIDQWLIHVFSTEEEDSKCPIVIKPIGSFYCKGFKGGMNALMVGKIIRAVNMSVTIGEFFQIMEALSRMDIDMVWEPDDIPEPEYNLPNAHDEQEED